MRSLKFIFLPLSMSWGIAHGQHQIGEDLWGKEAREQFGYSLSFADGGILGIGAPFAEFQTGYYEVLSLDLDRWESDSITSLSSANRLGFSIDVSDDGATVAIGSPSSDAGSAVIDDRIAGTTHTLLGTLDDLALGEFGSAVALSGDGHRLVIGAHSFDSPRENTGMVQVFEKNIDQSWDRLGEPLLGSVGHTQMGWSVDLSGDGHIMAVGSPSNSENLRTGKVNVYQWTTDHWQKLGSTITGAQNLFGYDIALSADGIRLVVGAPLGQGEISIYRFDGQEWIPEAEAMTLPQSSSSGISVSISADGHRVATSAIGSYSTDIPGRVAIFNLVNGVWEPSSVSMTGTPGEAFGWSISLSPDGEMIAIGAPGADIDGENNVGKVVVYDLGATTSSTSTQDLRVEIFPNPTSHALSIKSEEIDFSQEMQIIDSRGQILRSTPVTSSIDLRKIPPGLYFLVIPLRGKEKIIRKVIKN